MCLRDVVDALRMCVKLYVCVICACYTHGVFANAVRVLYVYYTWFVRDVRRGLYVVVRRMCVYCAWYVQCVCGYCALVVWVISWDVCGLFGHCVLVVRELCVWRAWVVPGMHSMRVCVDGGGLCALFVCCALMLCGLCVRRHVGCARSVYVLCVWCACILRVVYSAYAWNVI